MTFIAPRITVDPQIRWGKPVIEGISAICSDSPSAAILASSWFSFRR
jgi:hypothetical protein